MLLPLGASAIDVEIGGINYSLDEDARTASVRWKTGGYSGHIVIPAAVNYQGATYFVTSIGNEAFFRCKGLTSIAIPNSVTSIGERAFRGCMGLTSIAIPNSVTSIGSEAFFYCMGLTSIAIPNSVTTIGDSAFAHCSGLTSIVIPNSVTTIGDYAFHKCTGLTDVYVLRSDPRGYNAFPKYPGNFPTSPCTLHVPAGSGVAYRSCSPWSGFKDIVEDGK